MTKGEIRKQADLLLGKLDVAIITWGLYYDKRLIIHALAEVESAPFDWEKDVVKSVRRIHRQLIETAMKLLNS